MYYTDLSPYSYFPVSDSKLNVGWLDPKIAFPIAKPTNQFLEALLTYCLSPVQLTRGFHVCRFCPVRSFGMHEEMSGRSVLLGSAEIRVVGLGKTVYAAPDLIYHYVREHEYDPPCQFKAAVLLKWT